LQEKAMVAPLSSAACTSGVPAGTSTSLLSVLNVTFAISTTWLFALALFPSQDLYSSRRFVRQFPMWRHTGECRLPMGMLRDLQAQLKIGIQN
jgi:hypothetical protein